MDASIDTISTGLATLSAFQRRRIWNDVRVTAPRPLLQHGHWMGFGLSGQLIYFGFALESLLQ